MEAENSKKHVLWIDDFLQGRLHSRHGSTHFFSLLFFVDNRTIFCCHTKCLKTSMNKISLNGSGNVKQRTVTRLIFAHIKIGNPWMVCSQFFKTRLLSKCFWMKEKLSQISGRKWQIKNSLFTKLDN